MSIFEYFYFCKMNIVSLNVDLKVILEFVSFARFTIKKIRLHFIIKANIFIIFNVSLNVIY